MKVKDYMVSEVLTCRPQDTLAYAASLLLEHDCGCLPVIDQQGRVGAVITDRDICMAAFIEGRPLGEIQVSGSMSRQLVTCHPDDLLVEAAKVMESTQVRRLPVIDDTGKVVGILSLNDLAVAVPAEVLAGIQDEVAAAALRVMAGVCRHRAGVPANMEPAPSRPQVASKSKKAGGIAGTTKSGS